MYGTKTFPLIVLEISEPQHDKTNKVTVRPAKTQISLGIRPVISESSLCAQWVAKDPSSLHADSDAQADLRLRWAHSHFVGFVVSQLKLFSFWFQRRRHYWRLDSKSVTMFKDDKSPNYYKVDNCMD